jgi:hypothetical protein
MSVKLQHHNVPEGDVDLMDIVHKNFRLSEVIASNILDSDHLPIVFNLLDHARNRNPLDPVANNRLGQFRNLASELISPRIQINSGKEPKLYSFYNFGYRKVKLHSRI